MVCCRTVRQITVLPAHAGVIHFCAVASWSLVSITRTCGGDPQMISDNDNALEVLPAHAGVIPEIIYMLEFWARITRTCGGDPKMHNRFDDTPTYYPHMRG